MSAIRSDLPAVLPQGAGTAPAVRAAQADFFRAALAQIQGAQAQAQGPQTGAIQPTVTPMTAEPKRGGDEGRAMRPGSLLDIRV